jgi:hypothetical protein
MSTGSIQYEPLTFRGSDSMTSLYLWSEWRLSLAEGLDATALLSLQAALFELITRELAWQQVVAAHRQERTELCSIAVWKLPPADPGTAYLNGINTISTWDEYAALSEHILQWDANLFRSSGFGPARVEDPPEMANASSSPAELEPVVPFKEDLILVSVGRDGKGSGERVHSKDIRMRYLTVNAYKQCDVTGRFPYVETLAKNGVIQADVKATDELGLGAKPFKFINLSGLRKRTRWL